MSGRTIEVPDGVRRKALAQGDEGLRWLDSLSDVVAEFEREWQITVGRLFSGGTAGYVAEAVTADGVDAVVKLAIPDGLFGQGAFASELHALRIAAGRGHVRLLRYDEARKAMLQERLGRPLSALGLDVPRQLEIVAETLPRGWVPVPDDAPLPTGAQKATWLSGFIETTWEELDRPCAAETVEQAVEFARRRREAFDPESAVLVHGDAHPANILEDPTSGDGLFRLVDPDGMVADRAYDLAIPMRGWNAELLADDAVSLAQEWCSSLSALTGVDRAPIWEWAFIERVSTGLFIMQVGSPSMGGPPYLEVAEMLTGVDG